MPLGYFGRDYVLYRDEQGVPHILDAHCRHLGAHLGYGGRVEGSAIRCPFHSWKWGRDGVCEDIPYGKRIPEAACIAAFETRERNGFILLWHHAEGHPPDYEIPAIEEYGSSDWTPYSKLEWRVKSRMYYSPIGRPVQSRSSPLHSSHTLLSVAGSNGAPSCSHNSVGGTLGLPIIPGLFQCNSRRFLTGHLELSL